MAIEGIPGIKPIMIPPQTMLNDVPPTGAVNNQFSHVLLDSVKSLNNDQIQSAEMMQAFLQGDGPALHTVMLTSEQAKLNLEFAVQVRNKVMEAYQEVMRMQV